MCKFNPIVAKFMKTKLISSAASMILLILQDALGSFCLNRVRANSYHKHGPICSELKQFKTFHIGNHET